MGEVTKMVIKGNTGTFTLKINPESLQFNKQIKYTPSQVNGNPSGTEKFDNYAPATLSFSFLLDATGVAYKFEPISNTIAEFEKTVFLYDGNKHQPGSLTISWGKFVFKCHLNSLNYDYTLFNSSGEPLRVKVSVSFSDSIDLEEAQKKANAQSPDMTHIVVLKAGESIAGWCHRIYGDSSYCTDVARHNRLTGFRDIKPGTKVLFPPLIRNTN